MIIPHKMDNDVDSDEEQVRAGIMKLYSELKDRIKKGEFNN
jgi:hypothetical protein